MDGELVSGSPSYEKEGEYKNSSSFVTYTEKFYADFPYYLSIGMTYDLYWNGDASLPIYYRKADKMRNDRKNQEMWLQGAYIYDALCCVSPIFNPLAPKGTKAIPYISEPYALTKEEAKDKKEKNEIKNDAKALNFMEIFMIENNKKFTKKNTEYTGGENNG